MSTDFKADEAKASPDNSCGLELLQKFGLRVLASRILLTQIMVFSIICSFVPRALSANFELVDEGDIQGGGQVKDFGPVGTEIWVEWSDKDGRTIGWTETKKITAQSPFALFIAPRTGDRVRNHPLVADFKQWAKYPDAQQQRADAGPSFGGAISVLDVAAFRPMGSDFLVNPFPDFIRQNLGYDVGLEIPDLYADTDNNGDIGEGDILYSSVNLEDFFPARGTYNFGDTFSIVNGVSPLLPGFLFGTEPITRDANSPNGYVNPAPFTGTGYYQTKHDVSTRMPDAGSTFSLLCVALALVCVVPYRNRLCCLAK